MPTESPVKPTIRLALASLLAVTLFLRPARGADPAPSTPDERAKVVAPYIDDQTVAVAHVDFARVDLGPITERMVAALEKLAPDDKSRADFRREADEALGHARRWIDGFRQAGGRDLYVVFSLADRGDAPFMLVPLGAGADPKAVGRALDGGPDARRQTPTEVRDGVLIYAENSTLARLKGLKPSPRPGLAQALGAQRENSAGEVAFVPGDDFRKAMMGG